MTTRPPAPLTHHLQGRSDDELVWFQRRSVVQAAALWVAGGGWAAAHAQARSNIGAVAAADIGDTNTDFVAIFNAALV